MEKYSAEEITLPPFYIAKPQQGTKIGTTARFIVATYYLIKLIITYIPQISLRIFLSQFKDLARGSETEKICAYVVK